MELELVLSLRPELSQDLSPGEEFVSLCLVQCSGSLYGVKVSIIILQLNLHVTDLLFPYLSHHLTLHCLLIYGFSPPPFFPVLVCRDHKIVLHSYENKKHKQFSDHVAQILGNPEKSSEIN